MIGKLINKYRLEEKLGEGGMGLVFKAWDTVLERPVALKMMHNSLAQDEAFLQRFRSEAKAIAQLESPHIVAVHDLLETSEGWFIVMQFVKGETLADKIRREGALSVATALAIGKQILLALCHAHQAGVVHRDIKPGNVMLTSEGLVKVTDFGLAKIQRGSVHTLSHVTGGTLHYMPPEQIRNFAVADQRSDLYAVGMTIYEMLTGRLPFDKTEDLFALAKTLAEGNFAPPQRFAPNVPEAVSRVVMKALDKEANHRAQSAQEMLEELTRSEFGEEAKPAAKTKRTRLRFALEIGWSLALLALAAFFFLRTPWGARLLDFLGLAAYTNLSITTTPDSAAVRLNGKFQGYSPLPQRLVKAGTIDLLIQKKNYAEIDTTLSLPEDETLSFAFALTPLAPSAPARIDSTPAQAATGAVEITALPEGVAIFYKGARVGKTRYANAAFALGAHKFRLRREGYHDSTLTLTVLEGKTASAQVMLRPVIGVLKILVHPYGSIYVDNQLLAENADQEHSVSVAAGRHKIMVVHPTWGRREREITVKPDQPNEVFFDLTQK